MSFETLYIEGFRSYKKNQFKFHPTLTIIIGKNGSGKTNILEALYVLSTTKSWRAKDNNLLNQDSSYFKLSTTSNNLSAEIRFQQSRPKQVILSSKATKAEQYIGNFPVVLFEPASLAIVYGTPDDRRRFMNGVISQVDREYLKNLLHYRHVLKQRNSLLRQANPAHLADEVFAWDIKLVEIGSAIISKRLELLNYIQKKAQSLYREITKDEAKLAFSYQTNLDQEDYNSSFLAQLSANLEKDRLYGYTSVGPHRDDIKIVFNGNSATNVASRGEMRTIVLVAKVIERQYIIDKTGNKPTLLLDDVFSELDSTRRQFLLKYLNNAQTIVTATDIKAIENKLPKNHKVISLK